MKTKLIISGLAFLAITTVAVAQNSRIPPRQNECIGKGVAFIDADKNGVCDNNENPGSTATQGKRKAKGNCNVVGQGRRGMGLGQNRKINFADANKNGICDYKEVPSKQ
jgi:hypothetical protein